MEGEKYATNADDTKHSVLSTLIFILYSLGFDRTQTFTERSKTKPKPISVHFWEVRFSSVRPWFDRTESSFEHYSMILEIMRKFWRQLRPGGMSFEQLPEPRVHFCDGYEQLCRRSSLSNRSLSCLSLPPSPFFFKECFSHTCTKSFAVVRKN